ncbi:serine hydrolase domain-containing protein [Micromonospora endolithica]|uniref:Class A beta-lactamase-related serine hydrolase n=1 Tax=Micromonospora endolithica TaxID=230091 RepID=A0A3A9ZMR3_9ACTN|nr:serine hydrolase domain-containing protein [Micromonospora endolithica]RKN49563.1 class A beta-lactamase-related serine hydrolase [Micromonospora endolithica]TWJ23780.1 CubicO group peptidase (beta-lactamase class C family) [Micromonospora endolithica]
MRKPVVIVAIVGLLATLAGLAALPRPPRLGDGSTGDAALAAAARDAVRDREGYRGLAVALIEDGQVRTAGLGDRGPGGGPVEAATPFEIGSVGKVLTGMLLADQAAAVRPEDTLGAVRPEVTGPARDVTLAELASHRSGLPRIAVDGVLGFGRVLWTNLTAGNAYAGWDAGRVVAAASDKEPGDDRGEVGYSNFGMALLGQALAGRAGTPYPDLLEREVLRPLGMTGTTVVTGSGALPDGAATGATAAGRSPEPWVGSGYAPAGVGIWSNAEDLSRLVGAMLTGTAPGADAATPRFTEDERSRVGYGWFTARYGDREVVWHNGATGGFRSYVGFERATGRGVVVLGNTERGVEPIGLRLLGVGGDEADREGGGALPAWAGAGLALLLTFIGGLSLLFAAPRSPDRLSLVAGSVWAVVYVGLGHRLGDWSVVPALLWPPGVGVSAAGLALAAYRWREVPLVHGAALWRRATSVGLSTAAAVALFGFVVV